MPTAAATAVWSDRLSTTLGRFTEGLLRAVADRLLKPRGKKTPVELRDQFLALAENPVQIDRRLKEQSDEARTLLALIGFSRQPAWRLGGLLELLSALRPAGEASDGLAVVFDLLQTGLLFPTLSDEAPKLRSFEEWLGRGQATQFELFTHPAFARRAAKLAPLWPALPPDARHQSQARAQEADGLELPLRLGCLWQQVRATPLRLTMQGDFFKRDADRLTDPMLAGPWENEQQPLPDPGAALAALGLAIGLFSASETELAAAPTLAAWNAAALPEAIEQFVALLPGLSAWTAFEGWRGVKAAPSPYASAAVLALALLSSLGEDEWTEPGAVADWIAARHCWWTGLRPALPEAEGDLPVPPAPARGALELRDGLHRFLLGFAFQLRLTQATTAEDSSRLVRLSRFGRDLLAGETPAAPPDFPKILLVQPNLEALAYRQGLTPALIAELTRFAEWRQLGAACTLAVTPASVYRGLETGCTFESIVQILQRHGTKEPPDSVLQALRTWANKRDRLAVYAAAALLEFPSAAELEAVLARGLAGERVAERFLLVPSEGEIDYRHYRLLGTRDYGLPPGQCVSVAEDGVMLLVDLPKADLLLEAELDRFADAGPAARQPEQRLFQVTPASAQRAKQAGVSLRFLEEWFSQRTGAPLPPAVRLFFTAAEFGSVEAQPRLVLETPTAELADGLWQWPPSRKLLEARLGPTAVAVAPDRFEELQTLLADLPWSLARKEPPPPESP